MNTWYLSLIIGTALGFLAGLGTGGGSLLILWLTLAMEMSQQEARVINLLFFLPSAMIASCFRLHQGRLQFKKVLPAILAGSTVAGIFAYCSVGWQTELLRKLFGGLLVFTGIRELMYRPHKPG